MEDLKQINHKKGRSKLHETITDGNMDVEKLLDLLRFKG